MVLQITLSVRKHAKATIRREYGKAQLESAEQPFAPGGLFEQALAQAATH